MESQAERTRAFHVGVTHHLVHGYGAVRDCNGAQYDTQGIISARISIFRRVMSTVQPHKLDLFLWENGARNCSIVGATFWRDLEVEVMPRGDARREDPSTLAFAVRRQVEQIHGLAPTTLCRAVGVVSSILILPVVVAIV